MIGIIKEAIKRPFIRKQNKKYDQQLQSDYRSYDTWVTKLEEKENRAIAARSYEQDRNREMEQVTTISYVMCADISKVIEECNDILVLVRNPEGFTEEAMKIVMTDFENSPQTKILYGDEDEWNSNESVRMNPWLKPDWSPDTLLSFFYFGNMVAIRKEVALAVLEQGKLITSTDWEMNLYDFILQATNLCKEKEIFHSHHMLYHSHSIEVFGVDDKFHEIKETAVDRKMEMEGESKISIIIPSKDNVETLSTCMASIDQYSKECDFEIIVVDNGSSHENQEKIRALQNKFSFVYHYEKMDFNFSHMCNLGASMATGNLLLFLNDDVEVREAGWLTLLKEKAMLPHVGVVGAKLLYPNSQMIQHVGITNLKLGPVHKLQFHQDVCEMENRETTNLEIEQESKLVKMQYEYGRNSLPYNVIAVTGACAMMKQEIFHQVGGFSEELQVAFNDVDLCFRVYKMGYHNVVRNDVVLWHHESLSRGSDETKEKLQRLQREKERLYALHPDLYGKDPYYSPYYTQDILDTNYSFLYQYEGKKAIVKQNIEAFQNEIPAEWENKCLKISLEYAGDLKDWNKGEGDDGFFFQGYAFVLGSDNSCYERSVLLKNSMNQTIKKIPLNEVYRPDVEVGLCDQVRVNLCGFAVVVPKEQLEEGEYQVGMLAENKCCTQKLCNWTNRYVVR